jgi:fructosamine-3-kinase
VTAWRANVAAALGPIVRAEPVSGGEINEAFRVELADHRRVFVKTHHAPPPGMYAAEAAGLDWLRAGPLRIPAVLAVDATFLALEWLELGAREPASDERLGRGLAQLHQLGAPSFGLDQPNFLATIPQDNTPAPDIETFYVERRLRPLITRIDRALERELDAMRATPERFGPVEPPARLHGDLWWGNVAFHAGEPLLIDPAVYGGHREIDLAMLLLFGGLSDRFIAAYDEVAPLDRGWRTRVMLWQLYPLAAHAVLFGGGYVRQLAAALTACTRG